MDNRDKRPIHQNSRGRMDDARRAWPYFQHADGLRGGRRSFARRHHRWREVPCRFWGVETGCVDRPSHLVFIFFSSSFYFTHRRLSTENSLKLDSRLVPNLFRGNKDQGHHHHNPNSSAQSSAAAAQLPKLGYRSMVSVDDVPELFASLDSKSFSSTTGHSSHLDWSPPTRPSQSPSI